MNATPGGTDGDWSRLESQVADRLGLRADDTARQRLVQAAVERMRRLRLRSVDAYVALLESSDGHAELHTLAQDLTIGETFFLRGSDHFAVIAERVMPERLARPGARPRLRVLSAGCSSGEEIYSLAIVLRDRFPQLADADLDLVGIDITEASLDKARRGIYTPWSLRDVPLSVVDRHFRVDNQRYELSPAIRRGVRFERVNLLDPDAAVPPGPYDAIFCRNVLIYFTPQAMRQVIERFAALLAPGGYLFLGHSESLRGLSQSFELCQSHDTFYYRRLEAPRASTSLLDEEARRQYGLSESPVLLPLSPSEERPAARAHRRHDGNWFDAVQKSADRIAALARSPAPAASGALFAINPADPCAAAVGEPAYAQALRQFGAERYGEVAVMLADARDRPSRLLRAAALLQSGRAGEAQVQCTALREQDALDADAACLLGLCREQAADRNGARDLMQTAIYLDDHFAIPHLVLARLARQRDDLPARRRALVRAQQLLAQESAARLLMFGGGFSAEALANMARTELASLEARA